MRVEYVSLNYSLKCLSYYDLFIIILSSFSCILYNTLLQHYEEWEIKGYAVSKCCYTMLIKDITVV